MTTATTFIPPARVADPELNAALAKAQGEFPPIKRDRSVKLEGTSAKTGKHYEVAYDYAPLESILAAVRPVLAANGLSLVQILEGNSIRTELRHASGGWVGGSFPLGTLPDTPQKLGSLITYLRRYAIVCLLGIAAEEDDDGQSAGTRENGTQSADEGVDKTQHAKIAVLVSELDTKAPREEGQLSWIAQIREDWRVKSRTELTKQQAGEVIKWLEKQLADAGAPF